MKRLVICTGSSRGIGKSIVTEFNKTFSLETTFVLLARDLEKLNQVKDQILNESNSANSVILIQVDFSQPNQVIDYFNLLKNHIDENKLIDFEELYVVYNHGTLEYGNVSLVAQERLREKFETNLLSIWSLLGAINLYIPTTVISRQFHVNISSGYANKPVALWSGHCCCRVARDMLFKCLALEQSELRVLNYEPGVVYTDMLKQATEISEEYKQGYDDGIFTKPEETARKLIEILKENKFESGSKEHYSK